MILNDRNGTPYAIELFAVGCVEVREDSPILSAAKS